MLTQEQALAELRQLNQELGLAEDDGIPMTQAQAEAELRRLDEELASTPESFDEYVTRRKQEDSRSIGEKTSAFTDSFLTGAGTLAQEGGRAIKQLFSGGVGAKELKGVFQVGIEDFGRFAKTLGGAAMDNFYSDEEEMKREYERYKDNFLYNQNVRTAMLNTFDEEGRDFVSFGANFVDPTMLVPVAGQVAKLGSIGLKSARLGKLANAIEKGGAIASKPTELVAKGTRKAIEKTAQVGSKIAGATGKAGEVTAKAAALPRNFITSLAGKAIDPKVAGSGILGAQVTGAFTGAVPGLGLLTSAEVAGYIANKSGRGMERVLTALGSEAGQKRFLQRLAMQADSPTTRKLALYAHKLGGTRMGDLAFNSLVNGISVSTLNGALAYASTDNIEELGQAMGAGFAMGGALPVGQPGMKAGKSQAARDQSSVNFLEAKLGQDQLKQFRKMDPDARLAFATVEEAGIKAPKLMFVDKDLMLQTLREDDPNIRQAPNAYYNQTDNTIYVNENGRASKSSKEAFDILTHELGHGFITQAIKDDPLFARKILEQYEAKPGEKAFEFAFTKDSAGAPIDSIMLNEKAQKIASAYDNIQEGDKSIGVGQDANILAQEIGAEQFAMMMVDNPNYFNTIEPSLRQKLLEGSRKVLTLFGAVDGNTGNPLDVSISPILKRNKTIRNLYKNYTKQRDASIADKVDLAEKGVSMKVRKGESADQAVERLYGKQGISLKEAGAFRIDNKKVKNELTNILNRVDEAPEGGMSSERNFKSGKPQAIVGKQLSDEVKGVFTRKDPRGTINMLINDITESIRNRLQLNFLYRSGKPSKYSDNELKARVVSPVRFKVTGLSKTSPSAASLKMDAIDEAYLRNNVEVLVKEGFAKDPNKLIEQAREVARQAMDDPEGRINPEGKYENELITAVFGMEQSAPQIRNAKLRQLLEDKKLQHAYRSYDVDALAGLVPTGKSGIAFDYFNIKNNYSPFDDKLFMPTERMGQLESGEGPVLKQVPIPTKSNIPSLKEIKSVISFEKKDKVGVNIEKGTPVGIRIDIPTFERTLNNPVSKTGEPTYAISVHQSWKGGKEGRAGRVIGYTNVTHIKNPKFNIAEKGAEKIRDGKISKTTIATVEGDWIGSQIPKGLESWTQVGMNPKRHSYYYDRATGEPVIGGTEAVNVGGTVFVKNAKFGNTKDFLFMPASEAGAGKGKQAEAAKLWQEKGTESPYFKKYSGGAKIVKIGEQHDFVSGEPVVVEGVHGSTHTFKEFDPSKANPESDLGKAIYISNTPDEVGVNYAGEGPDLTGRIERKAETYMGMIEDELSSYGLSEDATQQQIEAKSYELARNELVGEGPQTYRVFAKFKNPVVVGEKFKSIDDFRSRGGKKETNFEMMFDEDAGTESGTLVDLLEQVDEVAYNFEFVDVDKVKSDIMEAADYESIGAQRLIETMKESEGLMDVMDANEEFANGEFVRQVFEGMGFDGIIDLSVNEKFGSQRKMGRSMEGMNPDTIHYLAFKPEQIKSATGNRGTFDAGERNILFMPASEAKNPKSGDMLTLDDKSLKLFLPSPGNPNASLSDFKGKNVQVLTTDLSMVGDKKIDGATVAFTGGPGYLSVNDAWGFTNESSAKGFRTRWEREGRPLIGLTSMKQDNHKASTLTREYYVRKFMQAINQGKIAESLVNEHIIEALTRAAKGKGLTDSQKRALLSVKNIEDFLRIFSNGQIIPWKATPKIYDRLSQATLPIKQGKLKELGLDLDTILRETRQKEYNDIKKGSLLAIAEYDGSDAVYRPDLNSAYPWSIPLKEKAFLKDFADIQDLSSRQDLRGSDGDANMAVAMGAGVMLDKLGRGDVNFMPSGRPTRQPANRITRQAPAMPGNRFMLPAVSAGAKSAERFR